MPKVLVTGDNNVSEFKHKGHTFRVDHFDFYSDVFVDGVHISQCPVGKQSFKGRSVMVGAMLMLKDGKLIPRRSGIDCSTLSVERFGVILVLERT